MGSRCNGDCEIASGGGNRWEGDLGRKIQKEILFLLMSRAMSGCGACVDAKRGILCLLRAELCVTLCLGVASKCDIGKWPGLLCVILSCESMRREVC